MLNKKISKMINDQINQEFYSAYLYLDFANYYNDMGLDGFSNWFDIQAREELDHAMMMREYLHDNGDKVTLEAIAKPNLKYKKIEDPLKMALDHEKLITSLINKIYKEASKLDDFRTMQFYDWFIKEQTEEEKNADDLVVKFSLFGSDKKSLYELNKDLKTRTYTPDTNND